jgi:plastocyanin
MNEEDRMANRIRALGGLLLACFVAGACTAEAPPAATPTQAPPPTAAPTPTATVAPTPVPSINPTPTPAPTIASTSEAATKAPKGATTITAFSNWLNFEPEDVSVKAGEVVLYVENVRQEDLSGIQHAHNFVLGKDLGDPLVQTPSITRGTAVLLTIADLPAGTYTYWCSVGDHYQYGMQGTLTAK